MKRRVVVTGDGGWWRQTAMDWIDSQRPFGQGVRASVIFRNWRN